MQTLSRKPEPSDIIVVDGPIGGASGTPGTYWFPTIIYSVSMANGMIVTAPDKYPAPVVFSATQPR